MKNEKIIATIKKLLALAESDNENEARLAATKANELLLRYNLSMQSLKQASEIHEAQTIVGTRLPTELKFCAVIIRDFFHVEAFTGGNAGQRYVTFVGEPTNVDVAAFTFDFLMKAFKKGFADFSKRSGARPAARQAYYKGLQDGLSAQLHASRQSVQSETGLILVKDPAIQRHLDTKYNFRKPSAARFRGDESATSAGFTDGQNMKIGRGISGSSSNSGAMLGAGK